MWTAEQILAALDAHYDDLYRMGVRKLGLFGSYVRGEETSSSDIDILVTLARPDFYDYMDIKLYLEALFGCAVDLVMEDGLKEGLRPHILREVVYVPNVQNLP